MRVLCLMLMLAGAAQAQDQNMILGSTTSTQNSGLLDAILPEFEAATGIHVYVVAVGTGQAIRMAQQGDADAILVHHRPSEDIFVAQGYGIDRIDVMQNDYVIIGPTDDPAKVANAASPSDALIRISQAESVFLSRGDDSGTHLKELEIWQQAGLVPAGAWYLDVGTGMGATLNIASDLGAYALTDRSTWLSFQNKGDLVLLFEGGAGMLNPYGYLRVNPAKFPHVNSDAAIILGNWLRSDAGQLAIANFQVDGVQLFRPHSLTAPDQQAD